MKKCHFLSPGRQTDEGSCFRIEDVTYTIEFEPIGIRLLCEEPLTISDAARQAGISLRAECGGKGICGKCLARVHRDAVSPSTEVEQRLLTDTQLVEGWRLACRTVVSADTAVYVPDTSMAEAQVIQLDGVGAHFEPRPTVQTLTIIVPTPSLADQTSDLQRVSAALCQQHGVEGVWTGLPALKSLRVALREGDWQIAVVLHGDEIIAAYPGPASRPVGLAVDVGTTKLACYLIDLETGQTLAAQGAMNPQIAHGEDVMSRLGAVMTNPANGSRLQQKVVETINIVAAKLCDSQGLAPEHLLDVCLVGNTAMHHLLLDLPVRPLALSPFVPALNSPLDVTARQIGLHTAPAARVYLPPPIAGFVGSDHLGFLLAAGFGEDDRTRLGIDIGTNTEIALQAGGRIVSCSTASGPAFEGAHIRHGMRAAPGAIERVVIDENRDVHCDVVGGGLPAGICGSGILDALAEMRKVGIINKRGRMNRDMPGVCCEGDGKPVFLLATGDNGRRDVTISQEDIDQILLAKGAIRAGINILMDHLGVTPREIDEIVIAGAFGTYLDPYKAVRIGLLPNVPLTRIHTNGNAAGAGARMMLASTDARRRATRLAGRIEYLELAVYPGFNKYFAQGVRLPAS